MRQTWRGLCTHGSKVPDAPSPSGAPLSGRGRRSTLPEQRGLAYSPLNSPPSVYTLKLSLHAPCRSNAPHTPHHPPHPGFHSLCNSAPAPSLPAVV